MSGLKAQAKIFLKSKGVKIIKNEAGAEVKLQQAKTVDVVKEATKRGF